MKVNDIEIMIGSDPELFVKKDGVFISGHELIPGSKEDPHIVNKGAVQVDGTALEFNTNPAVSRAVFHRNSNMVIKQLRNMIPPELELVANPTAHFAKEYMDALPEDVKRLGCNPDFNAYTALENDPPNAEVNFRTGAGHIHIGWTDVEDPNSFSHMNECRALVQALDIFLGAPSVLLDKDVDRRRLYGKAGAFRPKTYGLEYRVLSNFWVLDSKLRGWVYDNTIHAIERSMDRANPLEHHKDYPLSAINKSNAYFAKLLIKLYKVPLPRGFNIDAPAPVPAAPMPLRNYNLNDIEEVLR